MSSLKGVPSMASRGAVKRGRGQHSVHQQEQEKGPSSVSRPLLSAVGERASAPLDPAFVPQHSSFPKSFCVVKVRQGRGENSDGQWRIASRA